MDICGQPTRRLIEGAMSASPGVKPSSAILPLYDIGAMPTYPLPMYVLLLLFICIIYSSLALRK